MSQKSTAVAEAPINAMEIANNYVEELREQYRNGNGEYCGRRSPEQKAIAEAARSEAELLIDGMVLGVLALGGCNNLPPDADDISYGNHTWADFKNEFGRLLAGVAVITNRQKRGDFIEASYSELPDDERYKVASVLLSEFMAHNALRFGVDSSGIQCTKLVHNDEGGVDEIKVDKDLARSDQEIQNNMAKRKYTTKDSTHPAGKISSDDYIRLRKSYRWLEKDTFDYIIGFYSNAEQYLNQLEK